GLAAPSFPTRRSSDLLRATSSLRTLACSGRFRMMMATPFWRSSRTGSDMAGDQWVNVEMADSRVAIRRDPAWIRTAYRFVSRPRSEEHTSELQSRENL